MVVSLGSLSSSFMVVRQDRPQVACTRNSRDQVIFQHFSDFVPLGSSRVRSVLGLVVLAKEGVFDFFRYIYFTVFTPYSHVERFF